VSQPPDLVAILNAIRERPDDGDCWLALSSWLWDNGRDDKTVAARVLWPTRRDNVACNSLAVTVARNRQAEVVQAANEKAVVE
jgi:hypothetical protein